MSTADKTQPLAKIGLWARKNWRALVFLAVLLGALGLYLAYMVKTQFGLSVEPGFPLGAWKAYSLGIGLAAVALAGLAFSMVKLWKAKVHHVFLLVCIGFGCLYALLVPPTASPDETMHFTSAYRYSNLLMGKGFDRGEERFLIREDDVQFYSYPIIFQFEDNLRVLEELPTPLQNGNEREFQLEDAGNITLYFPQILAISIARLLHLGSMQMFYFGRILNLLFFAFTMYYLLRKMTVGKELFALVALLPVCLQQSASFSYDTTIVACGLFLMGQLVRLLLAPSPLPKLDMVLLCVAGALLGAAKYGVYSPLLLLLFLLPQSCFTGKWTKKRFAIVFGIVVALAFLAINIPNYLYVFGNAGSGSTAGRTSIYGVLAGPLRVFPLLLNTLATQADELWRDSLGGILGYRYKHLSLVYMVAFYTLLLLASLPPRHTTHVLRKPHRRWLLAASCTSFLALCLAVYSWTTSDAPLLVGMQGRYFLPFLPLVLLGLQNGQLRAKETLYRSLVPAAATVHVLVILQLLQMSLRLVAPE